MKMKNHPIQSRFFGRVSICNAKTVGREKAIAVYREAVPLEELEKWCQSKWYKLLEGTEWETIPKEFLTIGNYHTQVSKGWEWAVLEIPGSVGLGGIKKPAPRLPEGRANNERTRVMTART